MRKFSKILESTSTKKYFEVKCNLTLFLEVENEGEAGYLSDSILGSIKEQTDFVIEDIKEIAKEEYREYFESISDIHTWNEIGGYLQKEFEFSDFKMVLDFINKVGELSELENHHPEIKVDFNKVQLKLKTHDQNKITELDHKLAKLIDDIIIIK